MQDEYQDEEYRVNKKNGDLFTISENEYRDEVLYPYYVLFKKSQEGKGKVLTYLEFEEHYKRTGKMTVGL